MKTETGVRLALVVVSLLVGLFALELACRLWRDPGLLLQWRNFVVEDRVRGDGRESGLIADATLGFVPRPGLRPVPPLAGAADPPILATGDSFTYGAEVGDGETWPAYLQALVGRRTIDGGVPGYGLDQIVLRAEKLASTLRPAVLVVSFIADDVRRTEMSRLWGREKPYFALSGGELELRHVPVPADPAPGSRLPFWEHLFGWSVLVDVLRGRLLDDQHEWLGDHERALPRGTGEKLACPLLKRLAGIGLPTLVVAQYDPAVWQHPSYGARERPLAQAVLGCAAAAGLATLDLYQPIDRMVRANGLTALYGVHSEHHNPAGNRFVAQAIAAELKRRGMLP